MDTEYILINFQVQVSLDYNFVLMEFPYGPLISDLYKFFLNIIYSMMKN